MSGSPPTEQEDIDAAPPSGLFVRTMIGLTVILALGMVSLIFYRSQSIIEPTAAAMVVGDSSLDGTRIVVTSNGAAVATASLNPENNFMTPLLLLPGAYQIQATCNGETLLSDMFAVSHMSYVTYDLPTSVLIEGDSTLSGAQVTLSKRSGEPSEETLAAENGYAAQMFRFAGRYHLTVKYNSHTLRDEEISLSSHRPVRLALTSRMDAERLTDGMP